MGNVAFGALRSGVMGFDRNLLLELRAGWIGLMAAEASGKAALINIVFAWIFDVRLAGPVAAFARQALVLVLAELLRFVGVAFLASLLTRVNRLPRRQFC